MGLTIAEIKVAVLMRHHHADLVFAGLAEDDANVLVEVRARTRRDISLSDCEMSPCGLMFRPH